MDRLRLNPVSQRHVTAGSCAGVWLIGCEPVDGTVRYCVLLQCLFDRFGSVFPQCGLMVFPGVVIVSR